MILIFINVHREAKKCRSRLDKINNNIDETENCLEHKILYKFYIALSDIVQIHTLCRSCVTWLYKIHAYMKKMKVECRISIFISFSAEPKAGKLFYVM